MHWAWSEREEHWRGLMNREDCCTTDLHFANKLKQLLCAWGVRECGRTRGEEEEREQERSPVCSSISNLRHITQLRRQHVLKSLKYYNSDQLKLQHSLFREMNSITIIDEDRNLPWRCPTFNACIALTLQMRGTFKAALIFINTLFSLLAWELKYSTRTKKWCIAGWSKEPLQLSWSLQRQLPI